MSENGLSKLRAQLRAEPPAGLAQLADEDLERLADAVAAARRRQAAELEAAGEAAFRYVPRLLRGPMRKLLGG
jgi:hypothetical protein